MTIVKFNSLNEKHIKNLKTMVAPDRFSTGDSVLDLHAKDQSQHAPSRPEAVIWPLDRNEVAAILRYANEHRIPITLRLPVEELPAGHRDHRRPNPLLGQQVAGRQRQMDLGAGSDEHHVGRGRLG